MKTIFTVLLSVFCMSTLHASLIVTSNISESDFMDAFTNDRVWYAQLQPGGTGSTHPKNEFEFGGEDYNPLFHYEGNTSISDSTNNPFVIDVSQSNSLSVTFNGVGTPGGFQYGISDPFNTIWVGVDLNVDNGFSDTLAVTNHEFETDEMALLPDISLTTEPGWSAFKFYVDDDRFNIGEMTLTGNIVPDMFFGGSFNEDWTYTVFATQDPTIAIPEPSSFALTLCAFLVAYLVFQNRSH